MSESREPMESAADEPESEGGHATTVELPELDPRSTRQQWSRSALAAFDGVSSDGPPVFVLGTGHGTVRVLDADGAERWSTDLGGMVVALEPAVVDGEPVVLAGTRGEAAVMALLDGADGGVRWRHDLEADLGSATKETLFYYPMTVDLASDASAGDAGGSRLYAAARRYERSGGDRHFESRVYGLEPDGEVAWAYETDASPIALSRRDDRLAVAYNRCHGDHQCGLVVLDPASGEPRLTWDPGTEGGRRVGDVALDAGGVVLASHGDYRGYSLDDQGRERWRVDLGRPIEGDADTVYTYPNQVAVDGARAVFLTGNSFPEEGRDTDDRHPREHSLFAVERETGDVDWTTPIEGWSQLAIGEDGEEEIVVGTAQHFRDRTPDSHALRRVEAAGGEMAETRLEGIATAVAIGEGSVGGGTVDEGTVGGGTVDEGTVGGGTVDEGTIGGGTVAVLEEPISYHDEDAARGSHRLHLVGE